MKTLKEIAQFLQGELKANNEDLSVQDIQALEMAGPDHISFAVKPSKAMAEAVEKSRAGAFILPKNWPYPIDKPAIFVDDPYVAFAKLATLFSTSPFNALGISKDATIGKGCTIADEVSIHANVVIGNNVTIGPFTTIYPGSVIGDNSIIGEETTIFPNVTIYENSKIGNRVAIHAGTVIGSDGFGYAWDGTYHVKIPQRGCVVIEDDVEIGANCTIDRATFGETRIGAGSKIDNLVQIGHNVTIGPCSIIIAQVGVAGSAKLGAGVMIGGQAGVSGHISVGDKVKVAAQSGITKNIPAGQTLLGSPAMPYKEWLKQQSLIKGLPILKKEVKALEKEISELKKKLELKDE